MPLEACMICIDNSEYTRNGDYTPTRFLAQSECVQYVANAKLQDNQESSVGLMSMAGSKVEVLISPGREPGKIMTALAKDVHIGGKSNIAGALKTAQLALKNRQNKNQRQRIIMFVGSPIDCDSEELVKIAKNAKKNNVAIDVINFGTENTNNDNTEKLEALISAVNTGDNSHLVNIPPGPHIFADLVLTSPIMMTASAAAGGVAPTSAGASAGFVGGVDPNMDPEMAMAIRMSMEEERQRQQKLAAANVDATPTAGNNAATTAAPMEEEDEDALLAQAIALSMQENTEAPMDTSADAATTPAANNTVPNVSSDDINAAMQDPDFINSLLASVPGANSDEVQLDNLLDELTGGSSTNNEEKKDEKKDAEKK